jgi:hypothetical protein
MATLNEATQEASDYPVRDDSSDWNSVYGAAPEQSVNLGSLYQPSDPEVASGWTYGGDTPVLESRGGIQADPKESQRSTNPYSTPTGINWGQGNAQMGGSSGGGSNVAWATPFSQAQRQSGAVRGGITATPGAKTSYATIQESTFAPKKGTVAPTFAGPAYNQGEVKSRARKMAAPGLSQLNMKVQSAMSRYYENPNVRRMVLRDTLAGYGIGVSNIMAKAQESAQSGYDSEHARLYSEAMNNYNVLMANYMQQGNRVTSTRSVATKAAYEDAMTNKIS